MTLHRWCCLSLILILFGSLAPALAEAPATKTTANDPPLKSEFRSGDKSIPIYIFAPEKPGKYPAVLLLPGVEGLKDHLNTFAEMAKALSANGFVVVLLDHHARTDTRGTALDLIQEPFKRYAKGSVAENEEKVIRGLFLEWVACVSDCMAHVREMKNVDADNIGIAGISLGGYLAAAVGANKEAKVRAVAIISGGMPCDLWSSLKQMPPTLILHGDLDHVVHVREAYALHGMLTDKKLTSEIKIYEGVGHYFQKKDGTIDKGIAFLALQRGSKFFNDYLGKPVAMP